MDRMSETCEMGMGGMGGMGVMMLVGLLLIGVVVYVGVRAAKTRELRAPTARERLQHRLADGEITPDEYYEREAVLRDDERVGHKRRMRAAQPGDPSSTTPFAVIARRCPVTA